MAEQTSKPEDETPKGTTGEVSGTEKEIPADRPLSESTDQIARESGKESEKPDDAPDPSDVKTGDVLVLDKESNTYAASTRQQPSLYGRPTVEIAERSQDVTKSTSTAFIKDFVVQRAQYEAEDPDAIHARNATAVRQFMVNQGLRPTADVEFIGEQEYWDDASVILRYSVGATPAAVATDFDVAHTVISEDGPSPEERANYEGRKEARIIESRNVLRGA